MILKYTHEAAESSFQSPPTPGPSPCLLDVVCLVCFARTEHPEISIAIVCLELVLMMNYLSGLEFPTYHFLSFPSMNKFSRVSEAKISMNISIGLPGHRILLQMASYSHIHISLKTRSNSSQNATLLQSPLLP